MRCASSSHRHVVEMMPIDGPTGSTRPGVHYWPGMIADWGSRVHAGTGTESIGR